MVRSRSGLLEIAGARRRKGEAHEHSKAHRLQRHVRGAGPAYDRGHAAGGTVF